MDGGALTDNEIERVGVAPMRLEQKVGELATAARLVALQLPTDPTRMASLLGRVRGGQPDRTRKTPVRKELVC